MQSDDPLDYPLFRRDPEDCDANVNCMYFLGLRVNEGDDAYLDVYLSGMADGWVAIGFSEDRRMVSELQQERIACWLQHRIVCVASHAA